jgi:hypothetical protein
MFHELLQEPIVEALIDQLDIHDANNFVSMCDECHKFSHYVYEKFSFNFSNIDGMVNIDKNKIRHLIIDTDIKPNLGDFKNLISVSIESYHFNNELDFLPITLHHIKISSVLFNKKIVDRYPNLKSLEISSVMFNKIIDDTLISKLEQLTINCASYVQSISVTKCNGHITTLMFIERHNLENENDIPILE